MSDAIAFAGSASLVEHRSSAPFVLPDFPRRFDSEPPPSSRRRARETPPPFERPSPEAPPDSRRAWREVLPRPTGSGIVVRELAVSEFAYPWHYHSEAELLLILDGRGTRYVGDAVDEFGPGDLCLVSGGTPHCWWSESREGETQRAILVQFPHSVFGADFLSLEAARGIRLVLERASRGLRVHEPTRSHVEALVRRLADPGMNELDKLVQLFAALTALATSEDCRSIAQTAGGTPPPSTRDATRAARVQQYIEQHAGERISQSAAARLLGMSAGAFSRFFTRQFGKPFVSYMAELRVTEACRWLADSDLNVSEVAYRVGFNNLANFNRHFLRLKGTTPTQYRRKLRMV